jgi:hypothetical protein
MSGVLEDSAAVNFGVNVATEQARKLEEVLAESSANLEEFSAPDGTQIADAVPARARKIATPHRRRRYDARSGHGPI